MVCLANIKLFLRYLGAMLYDGFLLFGIVFCLAMLATAIPLLKPALFWVCLAGISSFFIWFWCRGGQTLGMRAWRIKLSHQRGIDWKNALLRLAVSLLLLGVGAIAILFYGKSLQDIICGFKLSRC